MECGIPIHWYTKMYASLLFQRSTSLIDQVILTIALNLMHVLSTMYTCTCIILTRIQKKIMRTRNDIKLYLKNCIIQHTFPLLAENKAYKFVTTSLIPNKE